MPRYEQLDSRAIIRRLIGARGIKSDRDLAAKAGVSQSSVSRYLSGASDDMEMATWRALAETLNVTVSQLLGESPVHQDPNVQAVLRAMESLPEEQRRVIGRTVESLAAALHPPKD